jgi:hypothetical protein
MQFSTAINTAFLRRIMKSQEHPSDGSVPVAVIDPVHTLSISTTIGPVV